MDRTARLREILAAEIDSPEAAELAARAAEALAAYMRAERSAAEVLGLEPPEEEPGGLAGKTLDDAAEIVLREAGLPLHVRDLGTRIKAAGWRHPRARNPRPDQIYFQLAARLPRHPDRFRRVAPNTFGLAEWGDVTRKPARMPRTGLFDGEGRVSIDEINEGRAPVEAQPWRSS